MIFRKKNRGSPSISLIRSNIRKQNKQEFAGELGKKCQMQFGIAQRTDSDSNGCSSELHVGVPFQGSCESQQETQEL